MAHPSWYCADIPVQEPEPDNGLYVTTVRARGILVIERDEDRFALLVKNGLSYRNKRTLAVRLNGKAYRSGLRLFSDPRTQVVFDGVEKANGITLMRCSHPISYTNYLELFALSQSTVAFDLVGAMHENCCTDWRKKSYMWDYDYDEDENRDKDVESWDGLMDRAIARAHGLPFTGEMITHAIILGCAMRRDDIEYVNTLCEWVTRKAVLMDECAWYDDEDKYDSYDDESEDEADADAEAEAERPIPKHCSGGASEPVGNFTVIPDAGACWIAARSRADYCYYLTGTERVSRAERGDDAEAEAAEVVVVVITSGTDELQPDWMTYSDIASDDERRLMARWASPSEIVAQCTRDARKSRRITARMGAGSAPATTYNEAHWDARYDASEPHDPNYRTRSFGESSCELYRQVMAERAVLAPAPARQTRGRTGKRGCALYATRVERTASGDDAHAYTAGVAFDRKTHKRATPQA
jgi:hypothetical protein